MSNLCRTAVPGFTDEELEWEPMSATIAAIRARDESDKRLRRALAEAAESINELLDGLNVVCRKEGMAYAEKLITPEFDAAWLKARCVAREALAMLQGADDADSVREECENAASEARRQLTRARYLP